MKENIRFLQVLVLVSFVAMTRLLLPGQSIAHEWIKTFGGQGGAGAYSVQQTADSGYILTGYTGSSCWLVKTDTLGNQEWSRAFKENFWATGRQVRETQDGGYIISGQSKEGEGNYGRIYIIKTDGNGNEIWSTVFDGIGEEDGYSVTVTNDGSYIITGNVSDGIPLFKFDPNGILIWSRVFQGFAGYSVQQSADGGFIITGRSSGHYGGDVLLIKTFSDGTEDWRKTYRTGFDQFGRSVKQTGDGGYIIVGETRPCSDCFWDIYLIRTDPFGDEIWSKAIGGSYGDTGWDVDLTIDGGFIIAGNAGWGGPTGESVYLLKTDLDGTVIWSTNWGGTPVESSAYSVQQTHDNGYILAGCAGGDALLIYYRPPEATSRYHCLGFKPPCDAGPVKVKRNRVIPFRAELFTSEGVPVTDNTLGTALPWVKVVRNSGTSDATDVTTDALPAGQGTERNEFTFRDAEWHYNLRTKNYSSPGTYTVTMESPDPGIYFIEPTCAGTFIID